MLEDHANPSAELAQVGLAIPHPTALFGSDQITVKAHLA